MSSSESVARIVCHVTHKCKNYMSIRELQILTFCTLPDTLDNGLMHKRTKFFIILFADVPLHLCYRGNKVTHILIVISFPTIIRVSVLRR